MKGIAIGGMMVFGEWVPGLFKELALAGLSVDHMPLWPRIAELKGQGLKEEDARFKAANELVNMAKSIGADVAFVIKASESLTPEAADLIKSAGLKLVAYEFDPIKQGSLEAEFDERTREMLARCDLIFINAWGDEREWSKLGVPIAKTHWGFYHRWVVERPLDPYLRVDVMFPAWAIYPEGHPPVPHNDRIEVVKALIEAGITNIALYGSDHEVWGWMREKRFKLFYRGSIPFDEQIWYYKHAKIVLETVPCWTCGYYFALRVPHAMYAGALVISDNPALNDSELSGKLVAVQTIDEIVEAVLKYLKDDAAREEIAKAGQEFAAQYLTWEHVVKEHLLPALESL